MTERREFLRTLLAVLGGALPGSAEGEPPVPRLQMLAGGAAELIWTSWARGVLVVEWRVDADEWRAAKVTVEEMLPADSGLDSALFIGRAELGVVPADSRIEYRIGGLTGVFRTPRPEGEPVGFLVIGDSGTGSEEQALIGARMAAERDVAFVLHTGDLAYPIGTVSDIRERYLRAYASMMDHITFLPCPGNHEYMTGSLAPYLRLRVAPGGELSYYTVRWGPVQIFSLDSNEPLMQSLGENEMLGWLAEELDTSEAFWRIAIFHHPPYTAGKHKDDSFVKLVRERLAPIMEARRVPLVLNGHEHLYQRSCPVYAAERASAGGGTIYVTTGGAGSALYPFAAHPLADYGEARHHYVRCRIEGGRMTLAAVDYEGRERDRVELAPAPVLTSLENAADGRAALAPGSLTVARGWHLGGPVSARLTINGSAVEVWDSSATMLRFTIPGMGNPAAVVRVETGNGGAQMEVMLAEAAPAVFPVRQRKAAEAGDLIALQVTGLGDPPRPVRVVFSGGVVVQPIAVAPASLAPGVYRVLFHLPGNLEAGELDLRVLAGTALSGPATLRVAAGRVGPGREAESARGSWGRG